jgi:hypothetical protein
MWIESSTHFAVRGYHWWASQDLVGRKDRDRFYVDIPAWIGSGREPPGDFKMPDEPTFLKSDEAIVQLAGTRDLNVYNHAGIGYRAT